MTVADDKGSLNLYSLLYDYVQSEGVRGQRLFVVHRLDRDTSGLLVFAKNIATKNVLQSCFEQHAVERRYEAVAEGTEIPLGKTARLEIELWEDRSHQVRLASRGRGKKCLTYATCLAIDRGRSYLDVEIVTGRRNQIRLSLQSIGMPIVGDRVYGGPKADRMFLNAWLLDFPKNIGLKVSRFEDSKQFAKMFRKE